MINYPPPVLHWRAALICSLAIACSVVAQEKLPQGEWIRQLVESSRTKAFSATVKTKTWSITVYRRADGEGNMLERRDYFKEGSCFLTSYRVQEGYFLLMGGKFVKSEIGGNFKDEEEPTLSWDWGWETILRDIQAEYTVQKKHVTIGNKQYLQITITTPVTVANLAAINHKSEAEMEPRMEQLQTRFPSVKQLTVDEQRNFIVMAQMFNASGRKLIELNWGKITYKEPSLDLFTLPKDGEVPVAKSVEDIGDIYGVELPNRESWMKRHLTVILVGLAVVVLVVGLAVKFRRR
ncbi:MAG: hypothetical protein J5654_04475 [Victivallales bacterium]|nr:hypothetical protein [Victivallales bacterium]